RAPRRGGASPRPFHVERDAVGLGGGAAWHAPLALDYGWGPARRAQGIVQLHHRLVRGGRVRGDGGPPRPPGGRGGIADGVEPALHAVALRPVEERQGGHAGLFEEDRGLDAGQAHPEGALRPAALGKGGEQGVEGEGLHPLELGGEWIGEAVEEAGSGPQVLGLDPLSYAVWPRGAGIGGRRAPGWVGGEAR